VSAAEDTDLVAPSGVSARLEHEDTGEVLKVRDRTGRLMVEIREGRSVVVHVAEGDLELRAHRGSLRLSASEGVEIEGASINLRAERFRQVVGVLETRAKRIVERTRDAYREADGTYEIKAGNVRTIARKTVRMIADRIRVRSKKDVKLRGEKIYLG